MNESPATPTDAASPEQPLHSVQSDSFDDRLLAKFGVTETPDEPTEATPASEVSGTEEAEPEIVEEAPAEPAPADFELKHNGEMKKVPMSEAQRLAQMGYDYEFKMQRVNEDVTRIKSMEQALQAREAMRTQTFDAMVKVRAIENQLAPYANVDWVAETNADPIGAFQKRMVHDQLVQQWQAATGQVNTLMQHDGKASQQIDGARLELEGRKLLDRIPEWRDATRRDKDQSAILETMNKTYGFAKEEIGGPLLADHRVVALLRDAMRYQQAVANQKAKKGPLQGLPKVATPGAKPVPKTGAQSMGDIKRAMNQPNISREQRKAREDELIAAKFGLK
jgi:hypothetical protein